jgi:hypothetical protein
VALIESGRGSNRRRRSRPTRLSRRSPSAAPTSRLQGPATDPRTETQYIVTEHGTFDLRAKSSDERALGLIGIAHPAFREQLLAEARRLNLVG